MKLRNILLFAPSLLLWACASEDLAVGEGRVVFSVGLNADVQTASRSEDELQLLARQAQLKIYNSRGIVRQFDGLDDVPKDGIALVSGKYTVAAATGDSVAASWDKRYFTGLNDFEILPGGKTHVDVNCAIANVASSVKYDATVTADVASNLVMTIGTPAGTLDWLGNDARRGYFMMPDGNAPLEWTLTGIGHDGKPFTRTGKISNPKRATEYVLNVRYSGAPMGHADFTITVDEHAIEVQDQVVISLPPEIQGVDFDITQPINGAQGNIGGRAIMISASSALTNATLTNEEIGNVNLMANDQTIVQSYYEYDGELDVSHLLCAIPDVLLDNLDGGTHTFAVTATDSNDYTTTAQLVVVVGAVPVMTNEIKGWNVWATHATVTAMVLDSSANGLGFKYRTTGGDYATVKGTVNGTTLTAELTNLVPGTRYEVLAVADGFIGQTQTFTTEAASQLPNSSFEEWQTSSTPFLIFAEGGSMFWDSGNHGSATLKKNVTTPDETLMHSGKYSAKLASQFVGIGPIGKFAAGNLFIGKYLETVGTDGVLGFGRPFNSRPRALKGYIKYQPQLIDRDNADCPDAELVKGKMDQGIIYIAVLNDQTETYKGQNFPVIVKTKPSERKLFDKEGANVIAYGQKIWTEETPGSGMVEFEIPLDYHALNVQACNIMIVAAASRGGDYFVGGPSTMWLDDLELVY